MPSLLDLTNSETGNELRKPFIIRESSPESIKRGGDGYGNRDSAAVFAISLNVQGCLSRRREIGYGI